jgi:hypothetical protein
VQLVWERHYSNASLPSASKRKGSFWWRDILSWHDSFKGMASVNIFDGATCLVWEDLWFNKVPKLNYPQLHSFAKRTDISIKDALAAEGPADLLHLPISSIALHQLLELASDLDSLPSSHE